MKLSLLLVLLVLFTFICNISAKETEDYEEDTLERPSLEENDQEEEDEEEPKQEEEEEDEEFKNPNTLAKTEGKVQQKVQETKVAEKVQETKVQNGETNMSFTA
jgi:flagellar biosynthesis/type III secretory pathway M-ring protein FliF/YscJ